MYHFIDKLHTLYGLLQDELSKDIFLARFAIDMSPSIPNIKRLVSLGNVGQTLMEWTRPKSEALKKLNRDQKKIILYGTALSGQLFARLLDFEHIDFYGFCGRHAERYPDGLLGKPVLSPDELIHTVDEYYVVPAVLRKEPHAEILDFLRKHDYSEEHILDCLYYDRNEDPNYFEFPALYRKGTVFIDGGCYDCGDSYRFAQWCAGGYSSIIAFEPDPGNYAKCCKMVQEVPIPNFQLVDAGLSDQDGAAIFGAENNTRASRIISAEPSNLDKPYTGNETLIHTVAIDGTIGERTVGFIKMDIEGAELSALHGAENTIVRDKPLLAICVYHLQGDLFAIMDYLHQIVPEYRFLLRHYSTIMTETVLYASVDL